MIRFSLRSLGLTCLALAFTIFAYDSVRMLANGESAASSGKRLWLMFSPRTFEAAQNALDSSVPYLWNAAVIPLLALPAWVLLVTLGSLSFLAGYRRKPPEIVSEL
jgi:hypothetical protein